MRPIAIVGALAAIAAAPLSAQGQFRTGDINPSNRLPSPVTGQILGQDEEQGKTRKSDRIPPGQLPPAGMCRIWIDGVPPGRQPAPTDCQTAVATKPANARVIWGDQTAFPGEANGKFSKHGKGKGNDKVKDHDRDDDDVDRDEARNRTSRGRVLGSAIPGASREEVSGSKGKGKGKGKGRG
jgi:hypothetical protein